MQRDDLSAAQDAHYQLQLGCYFSTFYDTPVARFTFSDAVTDFIWNHACFVRVGEVEAPGFIDSVIKFYESRDRRPCVYTSAETQPLTFERQLVERGFENKDQEAWMFRVRVPAMGKAIAQSSIEDVSTVSSIEQFNGVLAACFPADYTNAINREFHQFQVHKRVKHFLARIGSEIVGIGSLYIRGQHAVIHNMGTAPSWRQKGVATSVLTHLVNHAEAAGSSDVFLQCLGGGEVEAFYAKRGFETRWRRTGYVLDVGK